MSQGGHLQVIVVAILIVSCYPAISSSYRILLVGPGLSYNSHLMELQAAGEELISRGHEVYIPLASTWLPDKTTGTRLLKSSIKELDFKVDPAVAQFITSVDPSQTKFPEAFTHVQRLMCESARFILEDEVFVNASRLLHFDMAIVDRFPLAPCSFLVPHALRLPYVSLGAHFDSYLGGTPTLPSFFNSLFSPVQDRTSFSYRLVTSIIQGLFDILMRQNIILMQYNHLLAKYAPGVASWPQLVDASQLFFVTRESVMEIPQPQLPNVITVTSLTYAPPQPLPAELQHLLDAATDGVVVVTFGSIVSAAKSDAKAKMIAAFGRLKETVVWRLKIPEDERRLLPSNVHAYDWLPQNDLLGHKNTRLFITHCGNNGQYEALINAVPMVGMPLFAEQLHNAYRLTARGFGVSLNYNTFTADQLFDAIRTVIDNSTFRDKVKKASAILHDYPMTSRQTVAYWIEHVIKHGHGHLRSAAIELAWYSYFMVDVIAVITAVILVLLVTVFYILRCCLRRLACFKSKVTRPKQKSS